MSQPHTFGELTASGYRPRSLREELRSNLTRALKDNEPLLPGVLGYDDSVLPQLANALLAGQDVLLLGERGQAKSRIIRGLTRFLDPEIPVLDGLELPESPFAPVTAQGRALIAEQGEAAPIKWISRDERYAEKLATPDITIADLIGEVDPIKVAEGRYLADELTLHYGMIPRANLGIFAINELPDLAERIQVGLLNILEERDVQIRGHRVRLPLDILLVATANPEDYTNRGRIITPLKDRYAALIRTHYPTTSAAEIDIVAQEAFSPTVDDIDLQVPRFMQEIVVGITQAARRSGDVSQHSGVSVRASIASLEALNANAVRRALRNTEEIAIPRICDLHFVLPSLAGKIEFEAMEDGEEARILRGLVNHAVKLEFDQHFQLADFEQTIGAFAEGFEAEVSADAAAADYADLADRLPELVAAFDLLRADSAAARASVTEFVLEGLHLHKMLNKDSRGAGISFTGT
ncbi:MAG: sigma 54-interacting transcriptional regulator [Pseudomonadota bacterium]